MKGSSYTGNGACTRAAPLSTSVSGKGIGDKEVGQLERPNDVQDVAVRSHHQWDPLMKLVGGTFMAPVLGGGNLSRRPQLRPKAGWFRGTIPYPSIFVVQSIAQIL